MSNINRYATGWMWLALCLLAPGCALDWKGGPDGSTPSTQPTTAPALWQLRPVQLRVYPVAGLTREGTQRLVSLRLEFLDDMGDTLKAVGDLRIELLEGNPQGDGAGGHRLASWDIALRTLDQQRAHYDPITRTYHLRLRLEDSVPASGSMLLQVIFIPPQGRRLEAPLPVNLAN